MKAYLLLLILAFNFAAFGQDAPFMRSIYVPLERPTKVIQPGAQTSDSLALGNPSKAATDLNQPNNYLVVHKGFSLSYNKERGTANWVAWHLEKSNIGKAERTNAFAPDMTLPAEWWIRPTDYTGSGYDQGHLVPSADRSDSEESNTQTFLMSNMQPQVPKLNQQTWRYLEDYTREIIKKDSEAYIYAGCYGDKGRIKQKVTIPERCFKIIVVLANGDDDLKRVNQTTRVIAVNMPNDESVSQRWRTYLTTVDEIEKNTGFDFLSNVPERVQKVIEAKKDEQSTEPRKDEASAPATKRNSGDREYILGERGGCYYLTATGKKSYVDKKYCAETTAPSREAKVEETPAAESKPTQKKDSKGRTYLSGERGGCYYLTESGKKSYVDKKYCDESANQETESEAAKPNKPESKPSKPVETKDSGGKTYIKGERGGCYYLSPSGKKVYVKKELCN